MKNRVKELRVKNNLYQDALGRMVGASQQTISNIETGKIVPPVDLIVNIAHVFDVSVDTLLCQSDEYKPSDFNERLHFGERI